MKKIIQLIKILILATLFGFALNNAVAQNYSVTVKVNYLPVIVPNPADSQDTFKVCKYAPLNLKTVYVQHIDTNNIALADSSYTLEFSTDQSFATSIIGPDYNYILANSTPVIMYARATMNNSQECSSEILSFVLAAKPEPTFITIPITACYGVNVSLMSVIQSLTNGGANPLIEFGTDSATFTPIADPTDYDATVLGGINGGDYKLYARVTNTDAGNECTSLIMPFTLHIDTMPTLTLTPEAASDAEEICDAATVNLESYVASTTPATGTTLQFSINDSTFTSPLSGTNATNYIPTIDSTTQTTITVYVRALMDSTGCVGVDTSVKKFNLLVNPMPKVVLAASASNAQECDATTFDLTDYISSNSQSTIVQFSTNADFADPIQGADATSYTVNSGNIEPNALTLYVRAVDTTSGCVTVTDSVKSFTITVNPIPTTQAITPSLENGCSENTISYSIVSQTNVSYAWDAIGGTVQNPSTTDTAFVLWSTANSSAQVSVTYTLTTDGTACSRTATLPVNVLQSPTDVNLAIVSGNIETCDDGTNQIQLLATFTNGSPGYTIDYSWSPNSGTNTIAIPANGIFIVTPPSVGVDYTYTINKVTDAKGCIFIPAP